MEPSISDSSSLCKPLGKEPKFRGGMPDVGEIAVNAVSRNKAAEAPAVRPMTAAYAGVYSPACNLSSCEGRPMSRFLDTTGDGAFLLSSLTGTRAQ